MNKRFTKIEIDLENLRGNLDVVRQNLDSKKTKIMAIVKSNAYGHGLIEISKTLAEAGADCFGIALAEDGARLRKAGIRIPIYVLGESPFEVVEDAIEYDLNLCVNSLSKAIDISEKCSVEKKRLKIHVNIDTGMNRVGINYKDAEKALILIKRLKNLELEGVFTHFSCAGEEDQSYTMMQWERFEKIKDFIEKNSLGIKHLHCANSAAFLRYKYMHLDMVRLGLALYGLSPFNGGFERWAGDQVLKTVRSLKPVLSLKSKISFIKKLEAGESVSYGKSFTAKRESVIATVPVGYAEGYSRLFSNKSKVLINGMFADIVGNITMDQFMVDITDLAKVSEIKEGDEVVLIGTNGKNQITADSLALILGTINYEVICMLKDRITRRYIRRKI